MNFSLHYSIECFKNNNCFPNILNIYFLVNASFLERFPEKCSTFYSNARPYKEWFECSFRSQKYWPCVNNRVHLLNKAAIFYDLCYEVKLV